MMIVLSFSSTAIALTFEFEDKIDNWGSLGIIGTQQFGVGGFTYTHDISDRVDFAAGEMVTGAVLELDFTNDSWDGDWLGLNYDEHVEYSFDGTNWVYLAEVDNGQYDIAIDIALLNDDGLLTVNLRLQDSGPGVQWASLDHSMLSVTAQTPVPEPTTLFLFGMGILGTARLFRRAKK